MMTTTTTTTTTTMNTDKFTLQCSQPETNGAKLSRLIVDGGTEAIRRVLERYFPTPELLAQGLRSCHTTLLNLLRRRILNDTQWYLLFPKGGELPNSRNFDITLLFVLIRNVCGLSPPVTGWNAEPSPNDSSQEANIVRMRWYRNEIYAHASSTRVETAVFESCWKNVSEALVALGIDRKEIERLKSTSLDEQRYLQLLSDWVAWDEIVERELMAIGTEQEKNYDTLCSVQQGQRAILDAVQNKGVEKHIGNMFFRAENSSLLGSGCHGTDVYRGKLKSNGKVVAIKKMYARIFDTREAEKLRDLRHPNIIRCFAAEVVDDFLYIALELCDKTLAECMEDNLFKSQDLELISCLQQVAAAVNYLHENQVCHRDIKPGNILRQIKNDNTILSSFVLADFNMARDTPNGSFSTQKQIAGTSGWIAPEVYQPGTRRTLKVDIFSTGCVFYYVLANKKHPFGDVKLLGECQKNINIGKEASFSTGCFGNFKNLKDLVRAMVKRSPDQRPAASNVLSILKAAEAKTRQSDGKFPPGDNAGFLGVESKPRRTHSASSMRDTIFRKFSVSTKSSFRTDKHESKDDTQLQEQQSNSGVLSNQRRTHSASSLLDTIFRRRSASRAPDLEHRYPAEQGRGQLPQNRTYKMCDLDMEVKQKVSLMLDNPSYGVGGSKQLAAVYQMNKADVRGLSKQAKPAEQVLEYIGSKFPALTVYEFCMKLHFNQSLQRNDIVQVLSDCVDQKKTEKAWREKTYCVYYF